MALTILSWITATAIGWELHALITERRGYAARAKHDEAWDCAHELLTATMRHPAGRRRQPPCSSEDTAPLP